MSHPTDATHRNAGGDFFKRDPVPSVAVNWLQWSVDSDSWFWVGQTAEPLTVIGFPVLPAAKQYPHDATHDDMDGRAYKKSELNQHWFRYNESTGRWAHIGPLATTSHLIPRKAHPNELSSVELDESPARPASAALPVQPSTPEPVYPRRVTKFETADGVMHDTKEAAAQHMLKRDVQALLNARHNHLGMDEDGFIEDLLAHYELRQK